MWCFRVVRLRAFSDVDSLFFRQHDNPAGNYKMHASPDNSEHHHAAHDNRLHQDAALENRDGGEPHAQHGHSHADAISGVSDQRLLWAVLLNQLLTVVQVVAGLISGSAAVLSDAAHNFNDANALLIAWIARRISRRGANRKYTFGYRRAEMIGALINLTLLAVIGLYLVYEGVARLFQPVEIIGWLMAVTALVALVVDVATALLLWALSRGSLNVKAAFLHNIVDALGSVAVLLAAAAVIWLDWLWADAVMTLLIAAYVLWQVAIMLPQATHVLMAGVPEDIDLQKLIDGVQAVAGVDQMHHLHVWELDEQHRALEAHIVIHRDSRDRMEVIKQQIKQHLKNRFRIAHSTLEFEFADAADEACHESRMIVDH